MASNCLGCAAEHGDTPRKCAACGEVSEPRLWINNHGDRWDPMCERCTRVIAQSSWTGLQLTEVLGVVLSDE